MQGIMAVVWATFIQTPSFVDQWNRLDLTDEDLRQLESVLMADPLRGSVIPGTGGLRKLRFAPRSRGQGKRGSTRVCYAYFLLEGQIFLLTIYAKSVVSNLTPAEKANYARILARLKESRR